MKISPSMILPFQWEASVHSGQTLWLTKPQLFAQADEWMFFLSANYLASKLIMKPMKKIIYNCKHHIFISFNYIIHIPNSYFSQKCVWQSCNFKRHVSLIIEQIDIVQYQWYLIKDKTGDRPIVQILQCIHVVSHDAPFCNRNVHMRAHFCYKMVHCGIFV